MRAYLELLRPANVVTAVADVVAGSAVAYGIAHAPSGGLLLSTACLYAGGVALNDFFDRDLDARERPERPIPSGRVSPAAAAAIGFGLLFAGILAAARTNSAAGLVAGAIAALILTYDVWAKHHAIGPAVMGACRGLNLLLGVSAIPPALGDHWPLAFLAFFHIMAVTIVSRGEVHGGRRAAGAVALVLAVGVTCGLVAMATLIRVSPLALGLIAVFGWLVLPAFAAAWRHPDARTAGRAVMTGVLALTVLNAAIAGAYAGSAMALVVLGLGLLARALSRLFAVT